MNIKKSLVYLTQIIVKKCIRIRSCRSSEKGSGSSNNCNSSSNCSSSSSSRSSSSSSSIDIIQMIAPSLTSSLSLI